jgi:1-pyrroline-5-carboxylate dehydrogenase
MRPTTITRVAGLNRLKAPARNGAGRRYLTMLNPPKFENEKMVSQEHNMKLINALVNTCQFDYAKGSPERALLTKTIQQLKSEFPVTIPLKINGTEVCLRAFQLSSLTPH